MIEERFSVFIQRSPDIVFAVLANFETYLPQWAKGPVAAERLGATTGLGSQYRITAKLGPLKVSSPYVVRAWEPPRQLAGSGTAGPLRFDEEYELRPAGQGTELRQYIKAHPRGPFRLVEGALRNQLIKLIGEDLERLRDLVERQPADV